MDKPREWWISTKYGEDVILNIEPALPDGWNHVIDYSVYKYENEKRNEAIELCYKMEKERDEARAELAIWREYQPSRQLAAERIKSEKLVEALKVYALDWTGDGIQGKLARETLAEYEKIK